MSKTIIITGMHRSGTSLLSNLLSEAGVAIGERLLGPNIHNPRGYFEDRDFVELHDAILGENGTTWALNPIPPDLQVAEAHRHRARELIAERRHLAIWGWKDPRTCLFLDMWFDMLPNAKFVLVFRPAEQVVDSLRRRLDLDLLYRGHGAWLLHQAGLDHWRFQINRAIDTWLHYNEALIRFAKAHPEDCCTIELEHLADQFPLALCLMRERWAMATLRNVKPQQVLDRGLLHNHVSRGVARACRSRHDIAETMAQLHSLVCW